MTELSSNRVLVLGRPPDVLQDVMDQLTARGVSVQGSTDAQYAADLFDARHFDLISFGSAVSGSLNEHLRREFARQNPRVRFLDALAPIAAKQIVAALKGGSRQRQYVARSRVAEDGLDYLLKAIILKPCVVRIEVCRSFGAPPPKRRGRRPVHRSCRFLRAADRRSVPHTRTHAADNAQRRRVLPASNACHARAACDRTSFAGLVRTSYDPNIECASRATCSPIGKYHSLCPIMFRSGHDAMITRPPTT